MKTFKLIHVFTSGALVLTVIILAVSANFLHAILYALAFVFVNAVQIRLILKGKTLWAKIGTIFSSLLLIAANSFHLYIFYLYLLFSGWGGNEISLIPQVAVAISAILILFHLFFIVRSCILLTEK